MERITFEGNFCDISMCRENPCPYNGMCSQRETWERLKKYEDTGLEPEEIKQIMELCTDEVAKLAGTLHRAIESGEADHLRDLLKAEQEGRLVVLEKGENHG